MEKGQELPPPYPQTAYPPSQAYGQPQAYGHPQAYGQPQGYGQPQAYGQTGFGQQQQQQSTVVVTSQPTGIVVGQRPQNYLVASILVCLCCFWPTGLCAIFAASSANSAADSGDYALAEEKARSARNLIIASIIAGIICYVIIVVLRVVVYSSTYSGY